jgi:leucyl aminopeptidase
MIRMMFAFSVLMASPAYSQEETPPIRGAVELEVGIDSRSLREIDADVLVLPVFDGEDVLTTALRGVDRELAAAVTVAKQQGLLSGKLFATVPFFNPKGLATGRLLLIGGGEVKDLDAERIRRLAGVAVRAVRDQKVGSMAFFVRGDVPAMAAAAAATEGATIGLFDAGIHKSERSPVELESFRVAGLDGNRAELEAVIAKASLMARATNFARSITVEPANYLTPEVMASHARAIAREGGLRIEVFDEEQIQEMGMGGVWAVGKGSANPPRFIVLRYQPTMPSEVTLALVGKGVIFDSGGISLKGRQGMYRMKGDMAGGATVLGVMKIVSRLRPAINVVGIVPAVENIPGPTAQKPGDVFIGYSGKTVEVMSTDAEGRLILSDGLSYAVSQGATHLVDIATLTGTVRRALGDRHVGAFSSDDRFFAKLQDAALITGESFWRLPIDEEYARGIKKSLVADLNETGGDAGASIGAKFIQQFTDGKPWIHLDIAGLSWPAHTPPYRGAGPTGVTVRTLAELTMLIGETAPRATQ